ncbi:MAG: hypothetical protein HY836_06215 [Aquabacterium sp.]|uniref:hypothetical protein n=1 Tax=Aquabacterium sp. TaxID=1872578 RepID=UPI0025B8EC0A|nr:hypothetical protein [Aquabacterium sp.]MBI5925176.1 hypothetical protein [Aquabacterium sp.]
MSHLSRIFVVKIALTALLWGGPLLLFPSSWLHWLGFPVPEPQIFLRLLGMAYLALLVGYAFGLRMSLHHGYPAGAVWVGIVSNGGAFFLLAVAAVLGVWASWGVLAQSFMWVSAIGTGCITVGLVWLGPLGSHDARRDSCA